MQIRFRIRIPNSATFNGWHGVGGGGLEAVGPVLIMIVFPQVPPQKRGRFLGPAGLNMRRLTADTGVQEPAKDRLMYFVYIYRYQIK